ncbi:MAG: GNAT family N-acetyltransferase [Micromonosporaceae bacterium]
MTEQVDVDTVLTVQSYESRHTDAWEDLVARSVNGNMLHTRRFISYHGDRFHDRSVMIKSRRRLVGVFPAAEDPVNPTTIVSHPGLTFGGLVHDGSIRGARMIHALQQVADHYRSLGYRHLRYKAVPAIYHSVPAEDDKYALVSLHARRYQCDLSVALNVDRRGRVSQRRTRSVRRAEFAGVSAVASWAEIAGFWEILQMNLAKRHDAKPVHSLDEISLLHEQFPGKIVLITATIDGALVGGTLLFAMGPVLRMQFTATTSHGRAVCATDPMIEHAIQLACEGGSTFFDFGGCTRDQGRDLHQDLYYFKASFGGGGVVYEQYEYDL